MSIKFVLTFLVAVFISFVASAAAQENFLEEAEYWVGERYWTDSSVLQGKRFMLHNYKRYTKDDVRLSQEKLVAIGTAEKDEWEGTYREYAELSEIGLHWDSDAGFMEYYIFTCAVELRWLNYGRVSSSTDVVSLISEKPMLAPSTVPNPAVVNLIKVKIGNRRLLVPEDGLAEFCKFAAGLLPVSAAMDLRYWSKSSNPREDAFAPLILPRRYQRFARLPVEAKITKIGRRDVIQSTDADGKPTNESVKYYFSINAGANKGIEKGTEFFILGIREVATVETVSATTAIVEIERQFDAEGNETCVDENYAAIECKSLTVGMSARTQNNTL